MRAWCWLTAANWPLISIRPAGAPLRHTVVVLNRACTCADRPAMSANYAVDPAQVAPGPELCRAKVILDANIDAFSGIHSRDLMSQTW